ncbi:GNAT family N-acetyltransferase [Flavihumibacter sp. UBA7668]|uniref:GNAT family N-acetyltransferase n=1 Tax=Flavihumibacter sp. UBA7668 TaxID=1946542 RepID=UPI0025B80224|nr:GNAT family N-acetyltransferase [Flavihumibacter sp. UBA7668]
MINTDRLKLLPLQIKDAPFILELLNTPGWLKYIGDRNVYSLEEAKDYLINGPLKSYEINGYGLYRVELPDDTIIGLCGIINRETLPFPDIGFALLPAFEGKGYISEAALATKQYATSQLGIKQLCGITTNDNLASIRVLEKIGMKYIKKIQLPGGDDLLNFYQTD